MACNHKFQSYLHLEKLDFEPTTLIVGSFIPEWPENMAEWFYGRIYDVDGKRVNCFWDILPRLYGEQSLIEAGADEWKQFCRRHKIAVTDLISSIDDAEPDNRKHTAMLASLADNAMFYNFDDFVFVNIVQLLQRHSSIRNVYLTRGVTEAFWKHAWNPAMRYCNLNHLHERRLLPPSTSDLYQHTLHNTENPDNQIPLVEDYILMRWKKEWHF
jgi:hypothetical protein